MSERSTRPAESPETRLASYLRERASSGEFYCKSRFVAEDVDLTPSQIGHLLSRFRESHDTLRVEKWGYTNGTTWRIGRRD